MHWEDTVNQKLAVDAKTLDAQLQERQAKENKIKEAQKKRSSWFGGSAKPTQVSDAVY